MTADIALLRSAAEYACGAMAAARPELWARPTPCSRWDLRMLLEHLGQSVTAMQEGLAAGHIALCPDLAAVESCADPADPAEVVRSRIAALVDGWPPAGARRTVAIADRAIAVPVLAGAAAIEIAVHGWDVAQASGYPQPIPHTLGADLLAVATILLADGNRHPLFAPPVSTVGCAGPGDELVAFLGRQPGRHVRLGRRVEWTQA